MSAQARRELEERALDALLGGAAERALSRARLVREPRGAAELRALEEVLARSAARLRRPELARPEAEARFVASVLARTTQRAAPFDVRRALERARTALARAPFALALGAVAALCVVSLCVDGWWRAALAPRSLALQPAAELVAAAPPAPATAKEREALVYARRREAREGEFARERFQLQPHAGRSAGIAADSEEAIEAQLLAERAHFLVTREAEPLAPLPRPNELGPLALTLWIELELDRWVMLGERETELGRACLRLDRFASDPALGAQTPGTAKLVQAALRRAGGLGLIDEPDLEAAPGLLQPSWFAALRLAARESGLDTTPPWAAWVAWGRE